MYKTGRSGDEPSLLVSVDGVGSLSPPELHAIPKVNVATAAIRPSLFQSTLVTFPALSVIETILSYHHR